MNSTLRNSKSIRFQEAEYVLGGTTRLFCLLVRRKDQKDQTK